jgi:WD40 repeat protein
MVIKTTFGGANDSLVASGSEDMKIYIWHRDKEERLAVLEGHSANVNAVHWSPSNSYLFASASDDKTVRLWSVEGVQCEVISDIKERVKVDLFGNND